LRREYFIIDEFTTISYWKEVMRKITCIIVNETNKPASSFRFLWKKTSTIVSFKFVFTSEKKSMIVQINFGT
jgi:hypothetical protein